MHSLSVSLPPFDRSLSPDIVGSGDLLETVEVVRFEVVVAVRCFPRECPNGCEHFQFGLTADGLNADSLPLYSLTAHVRTLQRNSWACYFCKDVLT
jgi:hypothetical protein